MSARWTIAELAERVADSLAGSAGEPVGGQASARVRELPDARTIRWYQTTGLVDRPAALRGRTALYEHRHLAQLVAIKRLQAAGRSLAAIQAELAGLSTPELERIAQLPPSDEAEPNGPVRPRFWSAPPAPPSEPEPEPPRPVGLGAVHGVRLDGGVLLVLDHPTRVPDETDLEAVRTAARPLLAALEQHGLVPRTNTEEPR